MDVQISKTNRFHAELHGGINAVSQGELFCEVPRFLSRRKSDRKCREAGDGQLSQKCSRPCRSECFRDLSVTLRNGSRLPVPGLAQFEQPLRRAACVRQQPDDTRKPRRRHDTNDRARRCHYDVGWAERSEPHQFCPELHRHAGGTRVARPAFMNCGGKIARWDSSGNPVKRSHSGFVPATVQWRSLFCEVHSPLQPSELISSRISLTVSAACSDCRKSCC